MALSVTADRLKDVLESSRHYAFFLLVFKDASDRVRLSGTGLSVCKNSPVVTLKHILANWESCLCENRLLLRAIIKLNFLVLTSNRKRSQK